MKAKRFDTKEAAAEHLKNKVSQSYMYTVQYFDNPFLEAGWYIRAITGAIVTD